MANKHKYTVVGLVLLGLLFSTFTTLASETASKNATPTGQDLDLSLNFQALTQVAMDDGKTNPNAVQSEKNLSTDPDAAAKPKYKDRLVTANTTHKYLGLGSLGLAGLAVISPKEEDGPHEYFARGAAALGAAAVVTGLAFHYEDLSIQGGFSNPDNLHALMASLGALGFNLAVGEAPEGNHPGYGVTGAILMLGGIKVTW